MKILMLILATFLLLNGCMKRKVVNQSETDSANPGTTVDILPTPPPVPTEPPAGEKCQETGTGEQSANYYNLPSIISHGKSGSEIIWSSATEPTLTSSQNIFTTDSRINLRVLAKPSPGQTTTNYNDTCKYRALPYTKLKIKIGIRVAGSAPGAYIDYYTFDDVAVDDCSNVHEFHITPTDDPLIVEVISVKWDYSCIQYTAAGYPDVPQCPWDYVWRNDCFEMQIQMSTDHTKDIPH